MIELFKLYKKKNGQLMKPWQVGADMEDVSISSADIRNGSPKLGDMIAISSIDGTDRWLVSESFFNENYVDDL